MTENTDLPRPRWTLPLAHPPPILLTALPYLMLQLRELEALNPPPRPAPGVPIVKKPSPRQTASSATSPEVQAAIEAVRKAEAALHEARLAYQQAQHEESQAAAPHACRTDLERLYDQGLAFVRKYPGVGVGGAAVLGFLIGRSLRK